MTGGAILGRGIRVALGGRVVLDGIDVAVPHGGITGVVGPNGAGKSTLLRVLSGLLAPDDGEVSIDGAPLARRTRRERARLLAFVEQETPADVPARVRDVVALGRTPHHSLLASESPADVAAIDEALDAVELSSLAARAYDSLSGGERQRVQLARAFAQATPVVVLDEPTNHLDVRAQLLVLELIAERTGSGLTAIAALHDLGLAAAFCDHLVVLADGVVVAAGAPRDVLTSALLAEVFGVDAIVLEDPATGRPVVSYRGVVRAAPRSASPSARPRS